MGFAKKRLKSLTSGFVILLLCVLAAEASATAFYLLRDESWIPVSARIQANLNEFDSGFRFPAGENTVATKQNNDCTWRERLAPHPYLAFNFKRNPPCVYDKLNSDGGYAPDFPLWPNKDEYSILLTGGSVAAGLANNGAFEAALNRCYVSPVGDRFKVYNGGFGDWRYPQSSILFILSGASFDGVVTLEGANEYTSFRANKNWKFEKPHSLGYKFQDPTVLAAAWIGGRIAVTRSQSAIFRNSFLAFAASEIVLNRLRRFADPEAVDAEGAVQIDKRFELPENWSTDQKLDHHFGQWKHNIRSLHGMAKQTGARSAFFMQPVPGFFKDITPREDKVADWRYWQGSNGDMSYREVIDQVLALQDEGLPVKDLGRVFEGIQETVYADTVHFDVPDNSASIGNTAVGDEMARWLGERWNLELKSECEIGR